MVFMVITRQPSLFAAAVALLLVSLHHSASGYVLEGPSWASGSNIVFQLGLGSAGRSLIDGNTSWDSAIAPALDQWNLNIQHIHLTSSTGSVPVSSGDGINSIVFANNVFGQSFGASTLAITYYKYSGSRITEADVLFNRAQTFDSYRGPLRFGVGGYAVGDIRRILVHELGHALGLAHPDQSGQHVDAIMNSVEGDREAPSNDDIAGAQSLYGAPGVPVPTPTPTPTPTPIVVPPNTGLTLVVTVSPPRVKTGKSTTFTIWPSALSSADMTVNYTMSGSAVTGKNYSLSGTAGQVTIPAGQSSTSVTARVLSNRKNKGKTIIMTLVPAAGYTVAEPSQAVVNITN
jgi:hypothetical protein